VGKAFKAYLLAARELISGRLAELRDYVPDHMTDACTASAFLLDDGIIVRYDLVANPELSVHTYRVPGSVREWAPKLSEDVLYCPADSTFDPGDKGITFNYSVQAPDGTSRPLMSMRVAMVTSIAPARLQQRDVRPIAIAAVNSDFEILLVGETVPTSGAREHQFLVRNTVRAPVGWRTIEVYPEFNRDTWNPATAPMWAEAALYAEVTRRNLQEAHYAGLDPHAEARRQMVALLRQLREHLSGPEEPLHQFIRQHPQLLSPTHLHFWSKLPLGARSTDFVFKEPAAGYVLVELERASHRLFRKDGQPTQELTHAIDQVTDWIRYIEDNHDTVQRELGLHGISTSPHAIVVIGRRETLTTDTARKLTTMTNRSPRLEILTYDDVLDRARATAENMLGLLWEPGNSAQLYLLPPK
jgi:hypothetical protein